MDRNDMQSIPEYAEFGVLQSLKDWYLETLFTVMWR